MTYLRNNTSAKAGVRHISEPAPTVYYGARINTAAWVPTPDTLPKHGRQVTVAESGVLQSFPADYPWRGTRGQQYQQVGNAVPPALAQAVLATIAHPGGAVPYDAVDLFAGPGGWDEGARALGLRTVGVEYDHTACLTAVAAGHPRVRADVRTIPVEPFVGIPGLIASPPCPTFSAAGKGSGRHDLPLLLEAITRLGAGVWPQEQIDACDDERTPLTLEPLRWALIMQPEWIVLEQVKEVLPVWEAMAVVLREHGYSVATGNLQAEEYGVPQTRRRAVLVASRVREVALPAPTHTRYRKGKPRQQDGLLPWVSMADAMGWTEEAHAGRAPGRPRLANRRRPSPEKVRSWSVFPGAMGDVRNSNGCVRPVDEPSPTLTAAMDNGNFRWTYDRPATTVVASYRADVIAGPGWRKAGDGPRQDAAGSVRVSVPEAGVLQSFPADYPWQGTKTKQHQQVGNAVPPLLALAVLEAVT